MEHHELCVCPTCASVPPSLYRDWYKSKATIMRAKSMEWNGRNWLVHFDIEFIRKRYKSQNTSNVWTVEMWNKYCKRSHEANKGAKQS